MKRAMPYVIAALAICALGLLGNIDVTDAKREAALYCEMVAEFKRTNGDAGWPDYDKTFDTNCNTDGTTKEIR